jgi:uncharacterized protein
MVTNTVILAGLLFVTAVVYASVGQAGGSGYLAVMGLVGTAPEVMRPTALLLNVLVAGFATLRFHAAGQLAWSQIWPFLIGSVPLAIAGGALQVPGGIYNLLAGLVLILAAVPLLGHRGRELAAIHPARVRAIPRLPAVGSGAMIGLLAGLTGIGGGIFLSPLLLFTGWTDVRRMAGLSSAFILLNSVAALAGNLVSMRALPASTPLWAAAAVLGGLIGTELGSRRLAPGTVLRVLGIVLLLAGLKLIVTSGQPAQ